MTLNDRERGRNGRLSSVVLTSCSVWVFRFCISNAFREKWHYHKTPLTSVDKPNCSKSELSLAIDVAQVLGDTVLLWKYATLCVRWLTFRQRTFLRVYGVPRLLHVYEAAMLARSWDRNSVRVSHACFVTKRKNILPIFWYHMKG